MVDTTNKEDLFVYNKIRDYINQSLSPQDQKNLESLIKARNFEALPERYRKASGSFQSAMHGYYLDQSQRDDLISIMEDPNLRRTAELQKIDSVDAWDLAMAMRRRVFWFVLIGGLATLSFYLFAPKQEIKFNALQYIAYEALAMEENPRTRLNLPTDSQEEVVDFLERHPGLEFKPSVLGNVGADWKIEGTSVIDYEVAKVSVVQYFSAVSSERMFVFSFKDKLASLPRTELGLRGSLKYQTYTSEQLNLLAWQSDSDTVSIIVGRRSATDLANFALSAKTVQMKVQ